MNEMKGKYILKCSFMKSFTETHELICNKLTCSQLCDLIAQLVEHYTGIAEVMGSNPVGAS